MTKMNSVNEEKKLSIEPVHNICMCKKKLDDNIFKLMYEHTLMKNSTREYEKLQHIIRKEITAIKARWMKDKCEEKEDRIAKHDSACIRSLCR